MSDQPDLPVAFLTSSEPEHEKALPTIKEIAKTLYISPSRFSRDLHDYPSIGLRSMKTRFQLLLDSKLMVYSSEEERTDLAIGRRIIENWFPEPHVISEFLNYRKRLH